MNKVIHVTAPINFASGAGLSDNMLPQQFTGVAYSGGVIDDWDRFVVDLASTTIEENAPLLFQHSHDKVVGVVTQYTNNGTSLLVDGKLFSDIDNNAADVAKKSLRGVKYQLSMGIYNAIVENIDKPGVVVNVNGRAIESPIMILRNGRVRETSIAALGADSHTNAAFFSADTNRPLTAKVKDMADNDTGELQAQVLALTNKVTELAAQLANANDKARETENTLIEERKAARVGQVKELFAKVGMEYTDDKAAPYVTMSADVFAAVTGDMTAKPALPPGLFTEQATGDTRGSDTKKVVKLAVSEIYANRRVV